MIIDKKVLEDLPKDKSLILVPKRTIISNKGVYIFGKNTIERFGIIENQTVKVVCDGKEKIVTVKKDNRGSLYIEIPEFKGKTVVIYPNELPEL